MSKQAYDDKNLKDYDDITKRLNEALDTISGNPNLPATQQEVAKQSGVHRNTVRERGFPTTRLKNIKKQRKEEEDNKKKETRSANEQLKEERDKIAKEVVHWFSEFVKAKDDRDDFERQLQRSIDNASYYKREFDKQKETIKALQAKNEQLQDLLRDLK
ncbi:hypothetical protein [Pseudoalteromonas maricaloris]|uniref:Uncharacterized protein n=1 Tax=Pseudoalteromonas maricaloris TaxID=184924 RepID=A0A8I2KLL5_9GAMM|nr:hypothetical protein [Pseudoalteromonas maricaloris]NLR20676.1 hypothetical protein [Pseudoalteromonas maricaloris]WOX29840.1 hypothetical protein R5H13_06125 [Pseudoalteromonas maricaloris]